MVSLSVVVVVVVVVLADRKDLSFMILVAIEFTLHLRSDVGKPRNMMVVVYGVYAILILRSFGIVGNFFRVFYKLFGKPSKSQTTSLKKKCQLLTNTSWFLFP